MTLTNMFTVPIVFTDRTLGKSKISGELKRSAKIVWRLFLGRRIVKELIKFGVVGFLNVLVDWGIYLLTTRVFGLALFLAKAISSLVALTSSYILNRRWTFRSSEKRIAAEAARFLIVNGIGIIWNNLIFALFVRIGLFDVYALILTTVIVFFWNFILTRFWAFRK